MSNYQINIIHLYPDLLNLYGDKGNISAMKKRLEWRGIDVTVTECTDIETLNLSDADIVFLGGGSDKEMETVCTELRKKQTELKEYAENNGVLIALCGGFPMLGNYYENSENKVNGLGILDISTELVQTRMIDNVVLESPLVSQPIIGFVNHSGKTVIGEHTPLGKVICGFGNAGKGGDEGVIYKNVFASYLHGPLFPKNPQLCDYILTKALEKKYPDFNGLSRIDDGVEELANEYMLKRISGM